MSYLLAFYGDDFTGSTDVMEALTLGGVPTVLLLEPLPLGSKKTISTRQSGWHSWNQSFDDKRADGRRAAQNVRVSETL